MILVGSDLFKIIGVEGINIKDIRCGVYGDKW
jgi:hypothetical protein